MKSLSKRTLACVLAMCLTVLSFPMTVLASDTPSPWAAVQVNAAIANNLVPLHLQSNYTQAITRAEFCALAVTLYESMRGEITGRTTFDDTNDVNVEKAAYVGIVSGVGNNRFDPHASLTREQAAVMLSRLLGLFNVAVTDLFPIFYDIEEVSGWAVNAVANVWNAGIMSGVGDNRFAPQQPYTREQSIVTIMQMFDIGGGAFVPQVPVDNLMEPNQASDNEQGFEVGRVMLRVNGTPHEPGEHHFHSGGYLNGQPFSASGLPFEHWLNNELPSQPGIQYTGSLQIVVEGEDAEVVTHQPQVPEYYDGMRLIGIPAGSFSGGIANVSLPDEAGEYLVYVDVRWSRGGNAFTLLRYIFKVVK